MPFDGPAPTAGAAEYLEDPAIRLLVAFFQNKGLAALKEEDRQEAWYQDWLDYQAEHGLYASLLSPARYSSRGHRFDLVRLTRFLEVFAYFSPAHAYSLQVSFLGLFPILMSSNEPLKREAIARLENGNLFAFAVSERAHGSDLLATEFTLEPAGDAGWRADGAKYYIGNVNQAGLVTVFARQGGAAAAGAARKAPFAFFALRPHAAPAVRNVRKIRTLGIRPAFVGAFEVRGHTLPGNDVFAQGREAWDAVVSTVNLGKFFLGFGAVGICEHAFAEAFTHMRRRVLYGKPATEMAHLRTATAVAFARLTAMKFYAYRALDYLQAACADDCRYLLFNAVQKAKVSTEGVKVMGLLSECIGARGFEAETYFESALRDAQLIPGLEGSTHINYGLAAQFLGPYFTAASGAVPAPAHRDAAAQGDNSYLLGAGDRHARRVRFAPCLEAYEPLQVEANVCTFRGQVEHFQKFAARVGPGMSFRGDVDRLIAIGKCLATIAYGQLIAEQCLLVKAARAVVSLLFHGLIEDLSTEALRLAALYPVGSDARVRLRGLVEVPETSAADFETVTEFLAARFVT